MITYSILMPVQDAYSFWILLNVQLSYQVGLLPSIHLRVPQVDVTLASTGIQRQR